MRNKFSCVPDLNEFHTCEGDKFHITYSTSVNPDGTIDLVECGKENIQEYIDSFRDQTDIRFILDRLKVGDTFGFRDDVPNFGDFTEVPKTYAEVLQLMIDKESQFMQLPIDVRNSFDNDFKQWFATSGSADWFKKMDSVLEKTTYVDEKTTYVDEKITEVGEGKDE